MRAKKHNPLFLQKLPDSFPVPDHPGSMDFKAALQAEIEAKKRKLLAASGKGTAEAKGSDAEVSAPVTRLSVRQADLERLQQDEYLVRKRALDEQRQAKLQEKLAKYDKASPNAEANGNKAAEPSASGPEPEQPVEEAVNSEVERKLKGRNEPIRLFGEGDRLRLARLRLLEFRDEEKGVGQENEFKRLLEAEAKALEEQADGSAVRKQNKLKVTENQDPDDPSSISELERIDRMMLLNERSKAVSLVYIFLKTLLKEWNCDLERRSGEVKRSASGKMATATYQQACDHLQILLKALKKESLRKDGSENGSVAAAATFLTPDVIAHLVEIMQALQDCEYVKANDAYLRLSIGNAPWPIGVTMVGIHERSAHEKITSASVAHVLNDEVSRKWIQSVKRLMTVCQKLHPPSDPSKAMG